MLGSAPRLTAEVPEGVLSLDFPLNRFPRRFSYPDPSPPNPAEQAGDANASSASFLYVVGLAFGERECGLDNAWDDLLTISAGPGMDYISGRGAVWLARLNGVQEVAGSNP